MLVLDMGISVIRLVSFSVVVVGVLFLMLFAVLDAWVGLVTDSVGEEAVYDIDGTPKVVNVGGILL